MELNIVPTQLLMQGLPLDVVPEWAANGWCGDGVRVIHAFDATNSVNMVRVEWFDGGRKLGKDFFGPLASREIVSANVPVDIPALEWLP